MQAASRHNLNTSRRQVLLQEQDPTAHRLTLFREVMRWIATTAVVMILSFLLVTAFGFRVSVPDAGMETQIREGQTVLVNRLAFSLTSPSRQEVVAWYPGGSTDLAPRVGRIVAIPGETVQIVDGQLLINGVPDVYSDQTGGIAQAGMASRLVTLEEDEYFILEDNCSAGEDSRDPYIGPVPEEQMIGRVWLTLPDNDGTLHRVR